MPDKISIVTLTWNSEKFIDNMISSLINQINDSLNIELIIIDNGSCDRTLEMINSYKQKYSDMIKLVQLGFNMGTTFSRNIGLKMASGNYIIICDSDIVFPEGSLKNLVSAFEKIHSDKIGIIHPELSYPDGNFQESARKFPSFMSKFTRLLNIESVRQKSESIRNVLEHKSCKVPYTISAFWILKKEILEKNGYLDENIFYAPEDAEYCARLWKNGYEVWYYPEVKIIHDCQRLTKKKPFSKLGYLHLKGLLYFWKKYGYFLNEINNKA